MKPVVLDAHNSYGHTKMGRFAMGNDFSQDVLDEFLQQYMSGMLPPILRTETVVPDAVKSRLHYTSRIREITGMEFEVGT